MTAYPSTATLMVGELIEIKYRISRLGISGSSSDFTERWISARIVHNDNDAPPMARRHARREGLCAAAVARTAKVRAFVERAAPAPRAVLA